MKKLLITFILLLFIPFSTSIMPKAEAIGIDLRLSMLMSNGIVRDVDESSNSIYVNQQTWMHLPYANKRKVLNIGADYMKNQTGRGYVDVRSYQFGTLLMSSKYNVEPAVFNPYRPNFNNTIVPSIPNNQYGSYNQVNQFNQFTINSYGY